ncbi:peptidyl-prolyl cis-trans isomerase [Candidatus Woesearchaeota archaeon]|nr:peptidyl-prolyl cis-trans isomerase [Candidatus Woesearchaeota archaeon]
MDKKHNRFCFALFAIAIMIASALLAGCAEKTDGGEKKMEVAVIETSLGNIEVELNRSAAPVTVENFVTYVNEGFYDGTIFHRVIPSFMIQGGGFTPDGAEKDTHDPIKLESSNGLKNTVGAIAMARTMVPDSATSQFFINTKDNAFLDYTPQSPGYAVFGKVVSGLEVVKKIEAVQTGNHGPYQDWPVSDVVIKKVYMK